MKLIVTEQIKYTFDIPPKHEAKVRKDPDAWFCKLKKPHQAAAGFEIEDRQCDIEDPNNVTS